MADDKKKSEEDNDANIRKVSGPELAPDLSPELALDRLEDKLSSKHLDARSDDDVSKSKAKVNVKTSDGANIRKVSGPELAPDLSPELALDRLEDKLSSKHLDARSDDDVSKSKAKVNVKTSDVTGIHKVSGPELAPDLSPELALDRLEDKLSSKHLDARSDDDVSKSKAKGPASNESRSNLSAPGAYAVGPIRAESENTAADSVPQGNAEDNAENPAQDYGTEIASQTENPNTEEDRIGVEPQFGQEPKGNETKLSTFKKNFLSVKSDKRNKKMLLGLLVIVILVLSAVIYGIILVTQNVAQRKKDVNTDSKGNIFSNISLIIYSRKGITANLFAKNSKAQSIIGQTLLDSIASSSKIQTSVSDYSFVHASEALKGTSFSVLTYELDIKSSDVPHNSLAIQEEVNIMSSSGKLTKIANQLDTSDEFGFWIEHTSLTAIYEIAITLQYECTSETDLAKKEGVDAALKEYHEYLNQEAKQGFEYLSITNVVITSGECNATDAGGSIDSKIEYNLPVTCTGKCPPSGLPIIDTVNRRLIELFDDKVPFLEKLVEAFNKNVGIIVKDAQTDKDANGLVGCNDVSKCPSFTKFWRVMGTFDTKTNTEYLVDLSSKGNTLVIGYQGNDNSHIIEAYGRNQNYRENKTWTQTDDITVDQDELSEFDTGFYVSIADDGNAIAIGAYNQNNSKGVVKSYYQVIDGWVQKGQDLYGENDYDNFGSFVELANNATTILIGADMHSNEVRTGYARVYDLQDDAWVLRGDTTLTGNSPDAQFGRRGGITEDGTNVCISGMGANYISCHTWNETNSGWKWLSKGSIISGNENSRFGYSVALSKQSGNTLIVGSKLEVDPSSNSETDGSGTNLGTSHIYEFDGKEWSKAYSSNYGNYSGHDVGISSDGSIVVVAGDSLNSKVNAYRRENDKWITMGESLSGSQQATVSISSDGSYVAIGEPSGSSEGISNGKTTVYEWIA